MSDQAATRTRTGAFDPTDTRSGERPIPSGKPSPAAFTFTIGARGQGPAPLPFTTIRHYEIIRALGRGGMGQVFLARDTRLGRLVAIKLLLDCSGPSAERMLAEARATARCKHENIVVIHEALQHEGMPYMVLEYIEGPTLRAWMEQREALSGEEGARPEPVPPHLCAELMLPVARALACAHELGIVHRDLKPENILLSTDGPVKVVDFGIAQWLRPEGHAGEPQGGEGAIPGTLPYMAPEQWLGDDIDARVDIWAMGIILYELSLGKHPLALVSMRSLAQVVDLATPMPSARAESPGLGPLGALIDRCLEKHREKRIGSARELVAELSALRAGPNVPRSLEIKNPFAGLLAFQEADEGRFFGRERDIAGLLSRLRFQPLVAVAAPSGAGKSSFVRAGLIPAYKRQGERREALVLRPGRRPLWALACVLADLVVAAPASLFASTPGAAGGVEGIAETLRERPGFLGTLLRAHCRAQGKRSGALIFVDQFEELYTLCADAEERAAFLSCLEGAADDASSPLRVVLALRSDFLDRVADDRRLSADLARGLFFLAPLGRAGLREALLRPLDVLGYRFESEAMVEQMLATLERTRSPLPLLQFTAAKLWESRDQERRLLTSQGYESMGGVEGTLASHADAVLAGMSARDRELSRRFFERLVTPERTRAVVSEAELFEIAADPADAARVLGRLVEARLLMVEVDAGREGVTVEIVHESLIERWPMLSGWLDENQEDAAFLARLRGAAREWRQSGEPRGLLWRDEAMQEARRWRARSRAELGKSEREFLDAVFALGRSAARRRRLGILTLLAASVIVAVAMGYLAWGEREAREEATEQALQTQVLAQQARREASHARDAARLASARDLEGDPTSVLALLREVSAPEELPAWPVLASRAARAPVALSVLPGHDGMVWTAELSPDGRRVLTSSAEVAHLWNADGSGAPLLLRGHTGPVWRATFSPDGRRVLTASWDGTARIWSAEDGRELIAFKHPERVSWADFSPDGRRVVTTGWDSAVHVWSADGGGEPIMLRGHKERVRRARFSPEGTRVLTASFDGTARIFRADGSGTPVVLEGHEGAVLAIAWSPDGKRVATASRDRTARLWDAGGRGKPTVLRGHTHAINDVAWSPDGERVATASDDKTARVWRADATGSPVVLEHGDDVRRVVWSLGGERVLTCSTDRTARLWNVGSLDTTFALVGHGGPVEWAAFSADGERIVTAAGDGAARTWSTRQESAPVVFPGRSGARPVIAWSPDGKRFVGVWPGERQARVWRTDGSGEPLLLEGREAVVMYGAWSPDGRRIAVGSADGTTRVGSADGAGDPVILRAPGSGVSRIAFAPDGERVAIAYEKGEVRVWSAEGRGAPLILREGGPQIMRMQWTPDGSRLVTIGADERPVHIWRADGAGAAVVLEGHTNILHGMELSPDGKRVLTASADNTARIWNVDGSGSPIVLRGHAHEVRDASFSPDGKRVVTASDDGTLRVWNADGAGEPVILRQPSDLPRRAVFSPDGRRLLSATKQALYVWNADGTGVPLILEGHTGLINEAKWSPDGAHVASTAEDGTIRIWPSVREVPTMAGLMERLWRASAYCMPADLRMEILGVSEAMARQDLERCRQRVLAP